ncbi:gamma-interferon-inducible lysosomal thiol reductase-like [Palaemon carinicauda]|uniref:gamma-interferon-inducible lysosomal thiol reductase-like n=1 Tax=Palaemon carinicauda TaxID=392227 RepID=UPI0035B60057
MFALLLIASALVAATNAAEADPVKIGVYEESFCPGCRYFATRQLAPTYEELRDIMDVYLSAYGMAQEWPDGEGYKFECQHGPEECDGNQIHDCVYKYVPDQDLQIAFFICFMSQSAEVKTPWQDGEKCAGELGLDWETIKTCASSLEGQILHHEAGEEFRSFDPDPIGVPYITINGVTDYIAYVDLKRHVCNAYTGPETTSL